ncbi:MAG: SgcJ/EcaC family oxidoreductase [Gemmatimonadota bacterium]|nr:MAG: SgcJ/EcaC family oxidoreductase [Gemmatimonadota bacterium]
MKAIVTISRPQVLLTGLFLIACTSQQPVTEDFTGAISAANDRFMETFASGDGAALAELYTEDGRLLPPGNEPVSGQEAIGEFWQAVIDGGVAQVRLMIDEVNGAGDWVYELSRYAMYDATGATVGEGKYIVIWRRTAEGWRLHRDIWN